MFSLKVNLYINKLENRQISCWLDIYFRAQDEIGQTDNDQNK